MPKRVSGPLPADIASALPKLRRLCERYSDKVEGLSYGNPTFKRGSKPFAILDRYKGKSCLWLLVDPALRDQQIDVEGWFASPYDPHRLALCCALELVDWEVAADLIQASYDLAASEPRT